MTTAVAQPCGCNRAMALTWALTAAASAVVAVASTPSVVSELMNEVTLAVQPNQRRFRHRWRTRNRRRAPGDTTWRKRRREFFIGIPFL